MKRALFALLAASAIATPARAQLVLEEIGEGGNNYESAQNFAFELKFGSYSPNIDATNGLTGHPFSDLFNSQDGPNVGKRPPGALLTSLEFDWQFWHGFGSLGVAASAGIQRRSTHSFGYGGALGDSSCVVVPGELNCVRSTDTTTLSVIPVALELVYRFDVLWKRWRVPLVPYLKGGLGYNLWWIENGSGSITQMVNLTTKATLNTGTCGFGGDCGIGGSFGLVAHPGLAFLLDVLDPSSSRTMDNELGINHTYIFFELAYSWINGFNSSTKMNLSDTTWNTGLAFEF